MNTLMTIALALALTAPACGGTMEDQNKALVREFCDLAFNQHQPREAAKKYLGSHYRQHNPHAPDGAEAFAEHFEGFFTAHPTFRFDIQRMIAEGDLVVLHVHTKLDAQDRGKAVVDIFRVDHGKIAEHWDVIQDVPKQSANSNTMF
jgi:predicted SnoaL-like aldol condensation-catalyzing enzyme